MNQLDLFSEQDKLLAAREKLVAAILTRISDYKYVAYIIEQSLTDKVAASYCIEVLPLIAEIGYHLGYTTDKYRGWSRDYWVKKAYYNPYYNTFEPLNEEHLYRVALQYEKLSIRQMSDITKTLGEGDLLVREAISNFLEFLPKISRYLRNLCNPNYV